MGIIYVQQPTKFEGIGIAITSFKYVCRAAKTTSSINYLHGSNKWSIKVLGQSFKSKDLKTVIEDAIKFIMKVKGDGLTNIIERYIKIDTNEQSK